MPQSPDPTSKTTTNQLAPTLSVQRWLHTGIAAISLIAWASLAVQVLLLIGESGLLPANRFIAWANKQQLGFFEMPTLFWWSHSDSTLILGAWFGVAISGVIAIGHYKQALTVRPMFLVLLLGYLSYVVVGRTFFGFQWDNLLLETYLLALFVSRRNLSPMALFAFKLLLFKLYFESGIAKYQSHIHDWQDGSAMTYYYETAPIPARLAWYAHGLPPFWHHIESWFTLIWEILVPFFIFGPKTFRIIAFVVFTIFQLINISTANYGFFSYLAMVLHLVLLDDNDIQWVKTRLIHIRENVGSYIQTIKQRLHRPNDESPLLATSPSSADSSAPNASEAEQKAAIEKTAEKLPLNRAIPPSWIMISGFSALIFYFFFSLFHGLDRFVYSKPTKAPLSEIRAMFEPFRLINSYHLFGHITRARIEPEFQVKTQGQWAALTMNYKPGPTDKAPVYVAPHQPRVDFLLWFYGLSFRQGQPDYVSALLDRLCSKPSVVAPLFTSTLPNEPEAVRVVFWQYRMTPSHDIQAENTRDYWVRQQVAIDKERFCPRPTTP